ncbi:AAA family ATPase [Lacticaseibacillus suihuaensis]
MQYLESFTLASEDQEWEFFVKEAKSRAYTDYYPFQLFPNKDVPTLRFADVTILYGNNGAGKSTLLNVMAEKLGLARNVLYNRSAFFESYLARCDYQLASPMPEGSAIISSDEIFNFMLDTRALNQGIDAKRDEMFEDYLDHKFGTFQYHDLSDYDELKKTLETRRKTQSRYVREHLHKNVTERSNGESALAYFDQKLQDNHLYLLDEPENSLSPSHQQALVETIGQSARFFGCQFIIATHSPFVLALPGAKVYDLDHAPVVVRPWSELPEVRVFADFFKAHAREFKED